MLDGIEIEAARIKYPAVREGLEKAGIKFTSNNPSAPIVWWDGDIQMKDFEAIGPAQRINKIPGMDYLCFKSTTIHALNQMRRLFPELYNFFPGSFLLPHQYTDLQRAHNHLQGKTRKPVTWIVKPRNGCCGHGIRLIQHVYELAHKTDPLVVQRYISPYLVNGYKFDFRFYLLVSSLSPFTIYIYREGLARFCTQEYHPPTSSNLADKFSHLTNTSINKENQEAPDNFTKLASEVLTMICIQDPKRGPSVWRRICDVSTLTALAMWPSIVGSINNFNSERRLFGRKPLERGAHVLESFSKYFHILGIDIMLNENLQPIILELNDRPSMVVTYECEAALKRDLIYDACSHISLDGSPLDGPKTSPNFYKLLPADPFSSLAPAVDKIISTTSNVFRTYAANKVRPHFEEFTEEKPKKTKITKDLTFSNTKGCQ